MRWVDEFRDPALAQRWAQRLAAQVEPGRSYRIMEFCGGHTHVVHRHGLPALLPPPLRLIHGPGCPVCVLPVGRLDMALALARTPGVTLCTYGDALRVPASGGATLLRARAEGADVRLVHAADEALRLAQQQPQRQVVLLALGFETTTPPTAVVVRQAAALGLRNFSVLVNHVRTPAAMDAILRSDPPPRLDGILGPAHVSVVTGSAVFAPVARAHRTPIVVAGFEPLDVLQALVLLLRQVHAGRAEVGNQYRRAVTAHGNRQAQALIDEVFEPREAFAWRGLGVLPRSALRLRARYAAFDAERRFGLEDHVVPEPKGCLCPQVLRGARVPTDCRLFGRACTPQHPVGACMVSSEGACAAHYAYGGSRPARATAGEAAP